MSNFSTQLQTLESEKNGTYFIKKGQVPIIFTSAHGITQKKRNGKIKLAEPYTRAITRYVSKKADCYCLIKNEDTGVDPNKANNDEFKRILIDLISKNHIKMLVDVHGAKRERDFDVEIGTLFGTSAHPKIIDKLTKSLLDNNIKNIVYDDPFHGGHITKDVLSATGINCIQLEINRSYRNIRDISRLRKICKALVDFTKIHNGSLPKFYTG